MQPELLSKLKSRYQFHSLIGTGGAGEVYAAWDDHLKRTVAIKRIKTTGVDDAALANPWGEAMRLAAIRHANIVTVYDMGQEDDIPYIVMEHVQGEALDQRVALSTFSVPEFIDMARQTLEGLLAAHHAGLIHRDLKPSNIMLSPLPSGSFQVKILDFGMAKFLSVPCEQTMNIDGTITGSVHWISPEQLNRKAVDARSDLYSLGCVFYFALSGKQPFEGNSPTEIVAAHITHNVVSLELLVPEMPPLLAQWVMALINLEPEHRYQSAMQALGALNSIAAYTQSVALPVSSTTTIITPPVQAPLAAPSETAAPIVEHPHSHPQQQPPVSSVSESPHSERRSAGSSAPQATPMKPAWSFPAIAAMVILLGIAGVLGSLFHWPVKSTPNAPLPEATPRVAVAPTPAPPVQAAVPAPTPASPPPVVVAAATTVPAPTPAAEIPPSPPILIPIPEVVFRVHGSNTIGAKLLPTLVMEFLKGEGASNVQRKPGSSEEEMSVVGVMNGEQAAKAIEIKAHGSQTAFDDLLAGKCDLGMASRQIKPEEAAAISDAGLGDLRSASFEHVLGLDGIALLVNKDNPVNSLTKQQIAGIFSGRIANWQEVGGPNSPIHLYARDAKSGTFDTFKSLVLDKVPLAPEAKRFEDSNELSDAVSGDPLGIGFVGLPFVREAKPLAVSEPGTSPFIATRFTVATEDYLLSRRLFIYSDSASRSNPMSKKFIEFVLSDEGQAIVSRLGFVKQTPDLQRLAPPQDAPAQYVDLTKDSDRLSLNLRFRPGSTQLDNKAIRDMDRIINLLSQPRMQGKSLLLLGFADSHGAANSNEKLSAERAQLVAKEFAMRGFSATRAFGMGSALPVASNETEVGRDKNRRVEVWVK